MSFGNETLKYTALGRAMARPRRPTMSNFPLSPCPRRREGILLLIFYDFTPIIDSCNGGMLYAKMYGHAFGM